MHKNFKIERRLIIAAFAVLFVGLSVLFVLDGSQDNAVPADAGESVAVPILMYHSVCNNRRVTTDYRVTPATLESDLAYLRNHGYTAVFVSELIDFAYGGMSLPEKPIVITLDDGYLNNLTEALPLFEKYGMKAVISVVGEFTETFSKTPDRNPLYAYLTWDDIAALDASGIIEIGNHTYAMHELGTRRGCMKISGESTEKYTSVLREDVGKLQTALTENAGLTPVTFTYPYGFVSAESLPVIKSLGFRAALTCYEKINRLTGDPEELYSLGRFNRAPGLSTEAFMKKAGIE